MNFVKRLAAVGVVLASGLAATPAAAANDPTPASATPLIVGGRGATESYDGMVSVLYDRTGTGQHSLRCGAFLITPLHVVTNAHCVTTPDGATPIPARYRIRAGSHDHASGGQVLDVTRIKTHRLWDWGKGQDPVADIAVVWLARAVWLQPFPIGVAGVVGDPARLLGWGSTKPSGEGPLPSTLQELDTTILPPQACAAGGIGVGELCVDSPGAVSGACYGDSGGPALKRVGNGWWAVGGASRETVLVCGVAPTIYTDLSYYESWIWWTIFGGKEPGPIKPPGPRSPATLHWTGGL
ncbi:S1 family peptidase [Plantactinospora sp. CA-290183]|uniref:S1 family peptidase n=1 Tax=Plantactinospora sp. CA-290183 TaxID=3240006 RepID=UPI003D8DCFB5